MPRQDVPYGGAICRLRERIAEIWDELGKKLHSINGVEGDGQGDVKLVSGDPAVVITNDQLQNEIEISLDTSQLPAAAVSSVNGQTGAVALTADDIPSDNGDVQTDLDNLAAADVTLQGNINAEALARQHADSTLQTNINAALATIPGEVTSQIANNAQIIQLQSDVVTLDNQTIQLQSDVVTLDNQINTLGNNAVLLTGNQTKSGYLKFLNMPYALGVGSEIYQTATRSAVIRLCSSGEFTKTIIFDVTESTGNGRATVRFNISSSEIITEEHNIQIGTLATTIGCMVDNTGVYLIMKGYCMIHNMYIRQGGIRRVTPTEVTPFDVTDSSQYPNQLVITW